MNSEMKVIGSNKNLEQFIIEDIYPGIEKIIRDAPSIKKEEDTMIEIVRLTDDKYAVHLGHGYYHSSHTNRHYDNIADIKSYCLMSKEDADIIYQLLIRKKK